MVEISQPFDDGQDRDTRASILDPCIQGIFLKKVKWFQMGFLSIPSLDSLLLDFFFIFYNFWFCNGYGDLTNVKVYSSLSEK